MIATVTLNPSIDELIIVERLRVGRLIRARAFERYPAGKGINVSRVIHELGGRTLALGLAGGLDGDWLRRELAAQGIAARLTPIQGQTRNNLQVHVLHPPSSTQLNTPGPHIHVSEWRAVQRALRTLRPRPSWCVLSGSVPPGLSSDSYAQLIRLLRRCQVRVLLDSSGAAFAQGLRARPDVIKPNRDEAEELLGRSLRRLTAVARAARDLAARWCRTALVSLGPEGLVLADRTSNTIWHASAPMVKVRSTVGAGDSVVAGWLWALTRGALLPRALQWAAACGAACAMTPGTELVRRRDALRLLGRVKLRRLN